MSDWNLYDTLLEDRITTNNVYPTYRLNILLKTTDTLYPSVKTLIKETGIDRQCHTPINTSPVDVGRTPGSSRHLQHFPFLRGQRGGHARYWYRIGTDDPTRTTINDDGEERVCVRGTSLAFLSAVITCHGTTSLQTTTGSPGIWVTTVVQ